MPEGQWTANERKAANLYQRLKSLIMFVLPDDQMNYDTRSSYEYLNDLEEEYQERALLAKSKRFFKKGTQRFNGTKATDKTEYYKYGKKGHFARDSWLKASVPSYQSPFQPKPLNSSQYKPELKPTKDFKAKYNKVKVKFALLSSSASASKVVTVKNKGLIAKAYEWDEKKCHQMTMRWWKLNCGNITGSPLVTWKTDLIEAARQWLFWESVFLKQLFDEATFSVSTTRRHQTYETYHITFDESPDAIKFSKPLVDNINIAENKRYSPDEYLHPYDPSQRYQTNSNDVSFIEPYECAELFFLETEVSSDQNGQTDQNDQSVQNDEILNDDHSEQIIDNLTNTKDIQISEHSSSPREEDISVKKYNSSPKSTLTHSISGVGMLTRAMAKELGAALAHECLFIDFLSEEEPKKVEFKESPEGFCSCTKPSLLPEVSKQTTRYHKDNA
ncbi:hypothetical protein Tco_0093325 [Tanacetum coccineum]